MQDANITALRALQSLERTGSVSATAAELGLTQPAVSRAIAALEAAAGVALLHRGARPLTLTEEGQTAAAYARDITGALGALAQQMESFRTHRSGSVRMGSFGASASTRILPPLLKDFAARHPGIQVEISEAHDTRALEDLRAGLTDLSVLADPGEDFETLPIAADELVALVPAGSTEQGPMSPEDLAKGPFIMTLGGSEPFIREWFRAAGVIPQVMHRVRQTHSILALTASGLGRAIVAGLSLPEDTPGVRQLPLKDAPERCIVLARKHQPPRSHAAAGLWSFAERRFGRG